MQHSLSRTTTLPPVQVKRLEDEATAAALRDSVAAGSLQAAALRLEGLTTASAAADARTPGGLLTAQDRCILSKVGRSEGLSWLWCSRSFIDTATRGGHFHSSALRM